MKKITEQDALCLARLFKINLNTVPLDVFKYGIEVELEHGLINRKTNVTDDDLITTTKIAIAHLLEFPDYYQRLKRMEHEADLYWNSKPVPNIFN